MVQYQGDPANVGGQTVTFPLLDLTLAVVGSVTGPASAGTHALAASFSPHTVTSGGFFFSLTPSAQLSTAITKIAVAGE
jgi:hypothetical protein